MKPRTSRSRSAATPRPGKIHPVVIYPFRPPATFDHLEGLYELVARLDADRSRYTRPITVVDAKTRIAHQANPRFKEFRKNRVERFSDVVDAWCVDTCQMWYSGLAMAWEKGAPGDVYWLIPGDFNYGTPNGQDVLSRLHDLPEIILELDQDICVGEITTDHSNSKQLIDTYGTFALLYNWFPVEAKEIRQYTERPRSEFFALRHEFLGQLLSQRWFAYEQTVVMLITAVLGQKHISRFIVGEITDLLEGQESLSSAVQQVERTERVLKSVWRERHQSDPDWMPKYRELELRSETIRRSAFTVLENLLV